MLKKLTLCLLLIMLIWQPQVNAQENDPCANQLPSRLQISQQGPVLPGTPNNVRAEATTNTEKLGEIPGEGIFDVLQGPICADGIVWWQVQYQGITGWTGEGSDGEYWVEPLAPAVPTTPPESAITPTAPISSFCAGFPEPRLTVGRWGMVTPGDANNLRADPEADAALIAQISAGHFFQVLSEPRCTEIGVWWQVSYENMVGWTVEGGVSGYYLEPVGGNSYTNNVENLLITCPNLPQSHIAVDEVIRVLPGDSNVVRNAPSTFGEQVGSAISGAALKVLNGPRCEPNIAWWYIEVIGEDITGWTAEILFDEYLLEPITVMTRNNMEKIVELNSYGRGAIVDEIWWTQDSRFLIVPTVAGLWFYHVPNLTAEPIFVPHEAPISQITMSSDGTQIALGSADGRIFIYEIEEERILNLFYPEPDAMISLISMEFHESEPILQVTTKPRYEDEITTYYNTTQYARIEFEEEDFPIFEAFSTSRNIAFSLNGEHIAEATEDTGLNIRRNSGDNRGIFNMEIINSKYGNLALLDGLAYSPDGFWLVSVARDGRVKLWDVANAYEAYQSVDLHIPQINAIAVSPTQDIIAIGSVDGVVRLWNPLTGEMIDDYRTETHTSSINDLNFNADGTQLAVAYNNSTRIWDVTLGAEKAVVGGPATQIAFSPDGNYLIDAYDLPEEIECDEEYEDCNNLTLWQLPVASPDYINVTEFLNLPADFDAGHFSFSLSRQYVLFTESAEAYYEDPRTIGLEWGSWRQVELFGRLYVESILNADGYQIDMVSVYDYLLDTYDQAVVDEWERIYISQFGGTSDLTVDSDDSDSYFRLGNHNDTITDVEFHVNGNLLVSASQDGVVKVWGIPAQPE